MNWIKDNCLKFKNIVRNKMQILKVSLEAGETGGIVACLLLSAFSLTANLSGSYFVHIPVVIYFLLCVILTFISAQLLYFLLRILLGAKDKIKIFFFIAFLCTFLPNLVANQANSVFVAVCMSFLLAFSLTLFGSSIVSLYKDGKSYKKLNCVIASISLIYIILFGLFWNLDCFGYKRIDFYLKAGESSFSSKDGFTEYLKNGTLTVNTLTYGPQNADILTECVDLTDIGEASPIASFSSPYKVEKSPIAGVIYYPENKRNCPVLFIVHGAHSSKTDSYLGYEYLGEYLSSNGYVVVSIDENIVNELELNNDMRAVLLLENIKEILRLNKEEGSILFGKIDEGKIAIAGHSRGGEIASTAYLFNDLEAYPNNGVVKFDYHFSISSIIAIAPTVDQYMPAGHAVLLKNVNYLLLHGANDHDVSKMMGEKQYNNVLFTDTSKDYMKASVYILGANHGQFNSLWGRYDLPFGMKGYLNTNNLIDEEEQQRIAKAYFRVFLDSTMLENHSYKDLLTDNAEYSDYLPKTVYITNYMDSSYERLCSFDKNVNLHEGDLESVTIDCTGMKEWTVHPDELANDAKEENYVLYFSYEENSSPTVEITMPALNLLKTSISFRIGDRTENSEKENNPLNYTVKLTDKNGNTTYIENPKYIYPSLAIQLYKQDVLFGNYEYKHQMQTVRLTSDMFASADFDFENVTKITFTFDDKNCKQIMLDDICVY